MANPHPSPLRWWSLAVLCTANFITILDLFIVNVALENIRRGLAASEAELQLVIVSYSLAYGALLMNGARLGDRFGRRRVFLIGMGLFTLASLLCGISITPLMLIVSRALQGMGAALLMPQVLASLRVLFEGDERRRAFGFMGAVQGIAASISQIAGGLLIEHGAWDLGWRLIFLINLPIGLMALLLGGRIEETKPPIAMRLDLVGAATGAVGLSLLLVPIMLGRDNGWPWWSMLMPVVALAILVAFIAHQQRLVLGGGSPIIDIRLFVQSGFGTGVAALFLFYSSISSFFLSLTMLLQDGLGLSPFVAGLIFTPSAVAFFAGSLAGPYLARIFGRVVLPAGVLIFASGMALSIAVGFLSPDNRLLLILALVLNGAGQGIAIPLAINSILGSVDERDAGMASGALSTMQLVGTSVGVTIVGVIFFSFTSSTALPTFGARDEAFAQAFAIATIYNLAAALCSFTLFAGGWRRSRKQTATQTDKA